MTDRTKLKSITEIQNEEVKQLAREAENFLLSHTWCNQIENGHLAWAIAGVIGVFLFDIIPSQPEVDNTLWVITGDLPPAYLVTDDAESWQKALDGYVYEMNQWVKAVREGGNLDNIIPVNVEPTIEHAEMLEGRLNFIQENFINVPSDSIEGDS
ncbi:MAG: hypothetical protein ACFFDN_18395 [Candidatus Hodarchaeota archaeon]